MSIDKLIDSTKLNNSLTATANAIRVKTGVSDSINFDFLGETGFTSAIQSIPVGPIPTPFIAPKDVNFWDYDGTLLYAYTAAEFLQLESLPSNPSHSGLISQGWNWSFSDAIDYIRNIAKYLNIGQLYVTESGATEVDIEVNNDNGMTIQIGLGMKGNGLVNRGTVLIDWGDDTSIEEFTGGGSAYGFHSSNSHTYLEEGKYTVKIKEKAGTDTTYKIGGDSTYGSRLLYAADVTNSRRNRSKIQAIRCGSGLVGFDTYGLYACYNLKTITIHKDLSTLGTNNFSYCINLLTFIGSTKIDQYKTNCFDYCENLIVFCGAKTTVTNHALPSKSFTVTRNLKYAILNNNITGISNSAFESAQNLVRIVIPSSVATISATAFRYCYTMRDIHLLSSTPPDLKATSAFSGVPSTCTFYVPRSTNQTILNAYQTATNWATYSSQMEEEPE